MTWEETIPTWPAGQFSFSLMTFPLRLFFVDVVSLLAALLLFALVIKACSLDAAMAVQCHQIHEGIRSAFSF